MSTGPINHGMPRIPLPFPTETGPTRGGEQSGVEKPKFSVPRDAVSAVESAGCVSTGDQSLIEMLRHVKTNGGDSAATISSALREMLKIDGRPVANDATIEALAEAMIDDPKIRMILERLRAGPSDGSR